MSTLVSSAKCAGATIISVFALATVGGSSGIPDTGSIATSGAELVVVQNQLGQIEGKVLDHEGNPADSVAISIFDPRNGIGSQSGGGGGKSMSSLGGGDRVNLQGRNKWGDPVAKAVTDQSGNFRIAKKLKPGTYRIEAGDRATTGFRADSVAVKSGETTKVELKLTAPRGGRSNDGGNQGGVGPGRRR